MLTTLKENAWIAAVALFFIAVFRDAFKSWLTRGVDALGSLLYRRLAGSRLLRRRALGRYREGLVDATSRIQVPFRPNRPLVLDDIYIPLLVAGAEGDKPVEAAETLHIYKRIVVTGPPGAGKSMLLRRAAALGGRPDGALDRSRLPVLVELHRLADAEQAEASIERHIVDAFARYGFPRAEKFVRVALDRGWLQLLLDGFDEVQSPDRPRVARLVTDFLERERATAAVITCRTAVYRGEFEGVVERHVDLEPFEDQQIQAFLNAWKDPMPPGKSPAHLMAALREQPKLLNAARNPLLLTIIAHLYSDSPAYALPRSRAEFYRQAAMILLDQWQGHLGHNQFDGPDKSTVLSALALTMQEVGEERDGDRRTVARQDALASAATVMPSLGREAAAVGPMMQEIVERSGLLVSIDGGSRYTFAHLTFQEYFAAEALASRPDDLLDYFAGDPDAWREVVLLWCGLVTDCSEMIERVKDLDAGVALACVAEARAVDEDVADAILDPVVERVCGGTASEEEQRSLGAVAADVRPRGDRVLDALVTAFEEAEGTEALTCIAEALSASNRPRAAEAIVRRLGEEPRLVSPVTRLGELAVPGLEAQALDGGSSLDCACLAFIGTASAGVALARVMLKDGDLATPAAWGLTAAIESPLVVNRLARLCEQELEGRLGDGPALRWLAEPLVGPGRSKLAWLIGRAAALVHETSSLEDAIADPDPRIAMALCALAPGPLDKAIRASGAGVMAMVEAANSLVRNIQFEFDERGQLRPRDREVHRRGIGPSERRRPVSVMRGRGAPLLMFRSFVRAVVDDLVDPAMVLVDGKGDERGGGMAQDWEVGFESVSQRIAEALGAPLWAQLFDSLPAQLRLELFVRSARGGVTAESWPTAYSKLGFSFDRSRGYGFVLSIAFALSLVAVAEAVTIVLGFAGSGWLRWSLALLTGVSVVGTWVWMRARTTGPSGGIFRIASFYLVEALLGSILFPFAVIEAPSRTRIHWDKLATWPTFLFLPGGVWLAVEGIAGFLNVSWPAAAVAVAAAMLLAAVIAYLGVTLEQSLKQPFAGVFSGRRLAIEETAAV